MRMQTLAVVTLAALIPLARVVGTAQTAPPILTQRPHRRHRNPAALRKLIRSVRSPAFRVRNPSDLKTVLLRGRRALACRAPEGSDCAHVKFRHGHAESRRPALSADQLSRQRRSSDPRTLPPAGSRAPPPPSRRARRWCSRRCTDFNCASAAGRGAPGSRGGRQLRVERDRARHEPDAGVHGSHRSAVAAWTLVPESVIKAAVTGDKTSQERRRAAVLTFRCPPLENTTVKAVLNPKVFGWTRILPARSFSTATS